MPLVRGPASEMVPLRAFRRMIIPTLISSFLKPRRYLKPFYINASETAAIGDSPGDRSRFEFAHTSIAINPKGGIETLASHVITDDLSRAIPIVKQLLN